MTSLFDNLSMMASLFPEDFKKIALEIVDYLLSEPTHLKGAVQDTYRGMMVTELLEKLKQYLNGDILKIGNRYIDYVLREIGAIAIFDEYHDIAHELATIRVLQSDSDIFGEEIRDKVTKFAREHHREFYY